jgi:protoporphyrinogen oxidase
MRKGYMSSASADLGAPVIIIGAGLAGLTAGRTLAAAGVNCLILEALHRPGGLCRTEVVDGFTFDYTGHLLHLREGDSKDLILQLIGDRLVEHTRRASVYVKGVFVDYPIQAHFGKLPAPFAGQCLDELLDAADQKVSGEMFFDQWAVKRFGRTLADLFMIPYNAKLSVHPLKEMEISWTSWSVPVPTARDLRAIARGEDPPAYGYNTTFFYPRDEGIEILPRSLARGQEGFIRTGERVVRVNAITRTVILDNGEELPYSSLISTMPLDGLLGITGGLDDSLTQAAGKLRYSSVLGICMGLDGPVLAPDHWIYFPDEELPFYRMGFPTNFSDRVAPAGCGSVYAEVAWSGGSGPDADNVTGKVLETLRTTGLIDPSTGISTRIDLPMPCAYVFHDLYRAKHLETIHESLGEKDILSVGRYGAWEYSAMQDAVEWGLSAAREVLK